MNQMKEAFVLRILATEFMQGGLGDLLGSRARLGRGNGGRGHGHSSSSTYETQQSKTPTKEYQIIHQREAVMPLHTIDASDS